MASQKNDPFNFWHIDFWRLCPLNRSQRCQPSDLPNDSHAKATSPRGLTPRLGASKLHPMTDSSNSTESRSILMASLSGSDQAALIAIGHKISYKRGEMVFSCAEPGNTLLLIQEGRAEISITAQSGRKAVLNHMGAGEVLGEIALLDGGLRSADVTASTKITGLLFHRHDVMAFLRTRPEAMLALIGELCAKIRNASEMFEVQSQIEAPARLARCLLRLGAKWGAEQPDGLLLLSERFSQSDLGDFAGLTRESVNRHLKKWEENGWIDNSKGSIAICDQVALENLAQV